MFNKHPDGEQGSSGHHSRDLSTNFFEVHLQRTDQEMAIQEMKATIAMMDEKVKRLQEHQEQTSLEIQTEFKTQINEAIEASMQSQSTLYDTFRDEYKQFVDNLNNQEKLVNELKAQNDENTTKMMKKIDELFNERDKSQLENIDKRFDEMNKKIEQGRTEMFDEINIYIKEYFQEWLDIQALNQFKALIQKDTPLLEDWLSLSGVSY